jgi:HSP20 family molecular chaperone IbpA
MSYLSLLKCKNEKRKALDRMLEPLDPTYWINTLLNTEPNYLATYKTTNGITLEIPVPGFRKEDIKVTVDKGILSIVGKREVNVENYTGMKEVSLSYDIGSSEIEAELKDGILYVLLKKIEVDSTKLIEVK